MLCVVPTAIGIINALAHIATQKQMGLGAVAGGFTEMLVTFGLVSIVGSQVAAMVMLLRTLSRSHPIRTVVATISICSSGLFLLAFGAVLMERPAETVAIKSRYAD